MSDDIQKTPKEEAQPQDKSNEKEQAPEQQNKAFLEGKFKSEQEMEKSYKELEKKLGEQGEELKASREFATYVQPIIDLARSDAEVFAILDKKLRSKPSDTPQEKSDQKELRGAASDLLLARFESERGINKLPSDEAAKVRRAIGVEVAELTGQQLADVDLRRLPKLLEKAYHLVNPKSQSEAEDEDGSMPSVPSSPGKSESTLSQEEAKVAQKLGLTKEEYLKSKKGLAKEYTSK